jgi:hypothetical protein
VNAEGSAGGPVACLLYDVTERMCGVIAVMLIDRRTTPVLRHSRHQHHHLHRAAARTNPLERCPGRPEVRAVPLFGL